MLIDIIRVPIKMETVQEHAKDQFGILLRWLSINSLPNSKRIWNKKNFCEKRNAYKQ